MQKDQTFLEKKTPTFWAVILNRSCEPLPKDIITFTPTLEKEPCCFEDKSKKGPKLPIKWRNEA